MINFDERRFEISNDEKKLKLTQTEFLITKFLYEIGTVGKRNEIAEAAKLDNTTSNILCVYMCQLRKKTSEFFEIKTVRSSGYELIKK